MLAVSDALARLNARVGAASEPVREGLARRLALHEAAGWLGAQSAWVHPLDLALRAGSPAGPFGLATVTGRAVAEMPNTAGGRHECRLESAGRPRRGLTAASARGVLGRSGLVSQRRGWAQALFGAAALLSRAVALRAVPLPFWAAYPALDRDGGPGEELPGMRESAATPEADRAGAACPAAFCRLAREAALAGLRELGRLERAAERGKAATEDLDRRSRLPDALDAALRTPALTATLLAGRLPITPQTATAWFAAVITAVPELLDQLALENSIATLDAMRRQAATAETILARGGDHLLTLKGNHKPAGRDRTSKASIGARRKRAAWTDACMLKLLAGSPRIFAQMQNEISCAAPGPSRPHPRPNSETYSPVQAKPQAVALSPPPGLRIQLAELFVEELIEVVGRPACDFSPELDGLFVFG